ncbi:sigma-70 family RNA polymerase sigma factor [Alkaliphilus sp. B6464]|uniref:sigma-70 family RNA polymerase sigma factor n=1 Tax=Alkaliphilus sp. B6464 TaxID=2731219 RepID=UPI001BAA9F28|nr:sigma-70 family RNA polymerase sigma factor [Alkaliphilus sp. B6464]QUH22087.1 sigma-70 family RNA polymerase sigma factor [Alkaliphilus sp. B6464]
MSNSKITIRSYMDKKINNRKNGVQMTIYDYNNIEPIENRLGILVEKGCTPDDNILSYDPDEKDLKDNICNRTSQYVDKESDYYYDEMNINNQDIQYVDATTQYLKDIIPFNPLTLQEEKYYGKLVLNGNKEAREILVSHNLKLVIHYAKQRVRQSPLSMEELIQAGNMGLIRAVDTYDYTRNNKFSTHAKNYILAYMYREEENFARPIRLPSYMVQTKNKVNKSIDRLKKQFEREPTLEEISEDAQLPLKRVQKAMEADMKLYSLNVAFGEDNESEGLDFFSSEHDVEQEFIDGEMKNVIRLATKDLSDLEMQVIHLRHIENMSFNKISKKISMDLEDVKRIEEKTITILKEKLENLGLRIDNFF